LQSFAAIAHALVGGSLAILADGAIPSVSLENAPTWTLAGACGVFLLSMVRATWVLIGYIKHAGETLFTKILQPAVASQIALMDSLKSVQISNAASLASLAQSTDAIREDIHELRENLRKGAAT
jgi:hypothetical protein